jgi:CRP/FNR family transcriptional regulator, dissimilatory nitrate respiration regulator
MSDYREILRKLDLFKDITDFEYNNIMQENKIYEKKYSAGSTLLHQGDAYNELNIIIEGECNGEMVDFSGKIVKIEEFKSPYVLASGILFSKNNFLPVSVSSKTKVKILIISKNDILKICAASRNFLKNFLTDISDKLVFISQKISFLTFKTIKEKIANYLISLPKDKDQIVTLVSSIEELANLFGVSRPSLSRAFSELEEKKIIQKNKKKIKILDGNKLITN